MPALRVKVLLQDIKKLETEALIVGFHEDVRPLKDLAGELDWLLCGSLSNLIIRHKLRGSVGDVALLTSQGKVPAPKIFMIGLGSSEKVSAWSIKAAAKNAIASAAGAGVASAAIQCFPGSGVSYNVSVPALRQGLLEGAAGHRMEIKVLAPDAAAYEKISKLMKDGHQTRKPGESE